MPYSEKQDLIERLLEDNLGEKERGELISLASRDAEFRREISLHLGISEILSRLHTERQDENFAHSVVGHILSVESQDEDKFTANITRRIIRRNSTRRLAIAALATLSAVGAFMIYKGKSDPAPVAIATMTHIEENGMAVSTSAIPAGFKHTLQHGLLRIDFSNGAVVAIQAPADFTIDSPKRMQLHSGRLNAWCPDTAHGFQVVTSSGTATDLGTSFSIAADAFGNSDFLVTEGQIEVSRNGEKRTIGEGKAVRTSHTMSGISDLPFDPQPFTRTWQIVSGIESTTGQVVPAPPGSSEQVSALESDQSVFVIPERRGVPFNEVILAELTEPGRFTAETANQARMLSPESGMRLRSFLIRGNPQSDKLDKTLTGTVTFDRPALAILCQGKYLDATDHIFGNGSYSGENKEKRLFRGLDIDEPEKAPDWVSLSEDRRTVTISFSIWTSTDDVRVILKEE